MPLPVCYKCQKEPQVDGNGNPIMEVVDGVFYCEGFKCEETISKKIEKLAQRFEGLFFTLNGLDKSLGEIAEEVEAASQEIGYLLDELSGAKELTDELYQLFPEDERPLKEDEE